MDLRDKVVQKFGVSLAEADQIIAEMQGRREVREARAAALRGETVAALPSPEHEDRRRKYALGVLRQGLQALTALRDQIDNIIQAEERLIAQKKSSLTDHGDRWWDMRGSGWSGGGREHFAHCLCDVLNNLDETTLGKSVNTRMGFNRAIVLPEDLKNPVVASKPPVADPYEARFNDAMERVKQMRGVKVLVAGPEWKFKLPEGRELLVSASHNTMTVVPTNVTGGREPMEYRISDYKAEHLARLVRQTDKRTR